MSEHKIKTLDELSALAGDCRQNGKRVVLCHGMFDLVHLGHIRHFKEARDQGDVLFVTTTADRFANKGPGRPVFPEQLRLENLAALEVVDYVAICPHPTGVEAIEAIHPAIYAKGPDYKAEGEDLTGAIVKERDAVESHGGRIHFTDDLTFSSSSLLNEHLGALSPKTREFLATFRERTSTEKIIADVERAEDLRVLVLGDAIIDRYTYAEPLGQSGKGSHFVVRRLESEEHAGGAVAVANHIASFVKDVTLVSGIGEDDGTGSNFEKFLTDSLRPNVEPMFYRFHNAETVVKERFVDRELSKYFEVYYFSNQYLSADEEDEQVCLWLAENLPGYDLVVVPDYGNGLITEAMIDVLTVKANKLAVNTQINSGNRGYHVVTRYNRADFISLNEPELRLATHNRRDSIEMLARQIANDLNAAAISVTSGPRGLLTFDCADNDFIQIPALSSSVVDRVGAGDAYLALASICHAAGTPLEIASFVGAAAAALDVQIIGNQRTIDKVELFKYITALMK
ncbi:MAG: PfkB family carbohydrate kinase [Rhodospirillales bacterium]